jgi:RND superfamily putative drug exporter
VQPPPADFTADLLEGLLAVRGHLLSVAAAYGMLVFIFQDGHFERALDFTAAGGITNWMPLFLFVILFGLSMDYHVFVLSGIRERHDRGLPARQAIAEGITATAGVVTSAAVVMVAMSSLFGTLPLAAMRQLGVGLAAAILLDATLIRAVLLPAVMALLGEHNWYLPRSLGRPRPGPPFSARATASTSVDATGWPVPRSSEKSAKPAG